jgi:hypothetical protein
MFSFFLRILHCKCTFIGYLAISLCFEVISAKPTVYIKKNYNDTTIPYEVFDSFWREFESNISDSTYCYTLIEKANAVMIKEEIRDRGLNTIDTIPKEIEDSISKNEPSCFFNFYMNRYNFSGVIVKAELLNFSTTKLQHNVTIQAQEVFLDSTRIQKMKELSKMFCPQNIIADSSRIFWGIGIKGSIGLSSAYGDELTIPEISAIKPVLSGCVGISFGIWPFEFVNSRIGAEIGINTIRYGVQYSYKSQNVLLWNYAFVKTDSVRYTEEVQYLQIPVSLKFDTKKISISGGVGLNFLMKQVRNVENKSVGLNLELEGEKTLLPIKAFYVPIIFEIGYLFPIIKAGKSDCQFGLFFGTNLGIYSAFEKDDDMEPEDQKYLTIHVGTKLLFGKLRP